MSIHRMPTVCLELCRVLGNQPQFLHRSCPPPLSWGGERERKRERKIVTDVLGEINWIQGPAKPVKCMEKLFILPRFLRNSN